MEPMSLKKEPNFVYKAPPAPVKDDSLESSFPPLSGPRAIDLGNYTRKKVSNLSSKQGRDYFDLGLRHMVCYQHEAATHCFLACLYYSKDCALAHGLIALCHAPNYNFKGQAYYSSTHHTDPDTIHIFPSQQLADYHSKAAILKVEELRKLHRQYKKKKKSKKKLPHIVSYLESQLLVAIRTLTSCPGIDPSLSDETVGRPYADAMFKIYTKNKNDPEVAYFFAESLMVLHAWQLYEYPTGKPLSPDVQLVRQVLETSLKQHPHHAGLCHMYVHLSEMSSNPSKALQACPALRTRFPHAGHLIHMSTHIDVLVGDYDSCVRWNYAAIRADGVSLQNSPSTAGTTSFYFGYIVHNYHMLVYGAILGGFELIAQQVAAELNDMLNEDAFGEYPYLVSYLESYSALDLHILVRFGRWNEILELEPPRDKRLMLFRAATIAYARGLAFAQLGNIEAAKREANRFDSIRNQPEAEERILHNNQVSDLLAVDAPMLRGEIAYKQGNYEQAFKLLTRAVELQDGLLFDEPWGKMQPVRHALGGLLLEQGHVEKATEVFETDLKFHPNNPWALTGLISCLKQTCCCGKNVENGADTSARIQALQEALDKQRQSEWADYNIVVSCACCQSDAINGNN